MTSIESKPMNRNSKMAEPLNIPEIPNGKNPPSPASVSTNAVAFFSDGRQFDASTAENSVTRIKIETPQIALLMIFESVI